MRLHIVTAVVLAVLSLPPRVTAQQSVTRAQAVVTALARGARAALGRADTTAARGLVLTARAFPKPALRASYAKDLPQDHAALDLPLHPPGLRGTGIGAGESARGCKRLGS